MSPIFAFGFGYQELLIVAGIMLLLFGHRLPSIMRSMGSGIREFKEGIAGNYDDEDSPNHIEKK